MLSRNVTPVQDNAQICVPAAQPQPSRDLDWTDGLWLARTLAGDVAEELCRTGALPGASSTWQLALGQVAAAAAQRR
jgi:hypothetical protein